MFKEQTERNYDCAACVSYFCEIILLKICDARLLYRFFSMKILFAMLYIWQFHVDTHNARRAEKKIGKLSRKCVGNELLMTEEHVHIFLLAAKHTQRTRMKIRFSRMEFCVANNKKKRIKREKRIQIGTMRTIETVWNDEEHVDWIGGKS